MGEFLVKVTGCTAATILAILLYISSLPLYLSIQVPTHWIAVQLLFVPTAMAMYACLVSHHLLDSSVFKVPPGCRTSPEGEVMLAALFTLMSWRGIYSSQMF